MNFIHQNYNNNVSYSLQCIFLYQRSLYIYMASSHCLVSFHFNLKHSLQHFQQGRCSGNKLPQLLFIQDCLNFSLTLKDSFLDIKLSFESFCFQYLNISSYCLLVPKIYAEKLTDNLIETPLECDKSLFSCCFQDSLFVFGKLDYNMSWYGSL